jgi:hypothetical protein
MAMSLASASPSDCSGVVCRSTKQIGVDPSAARWTTRIFDRKDCFGPAEGSAHFDELTVHRSPPPLQGELLPGQDCGSAGDDDPEE